LFVALGLSLYALACLLLAIGYTAEAPDEPD